MLQRLCWVVLALMVTTAAFAEDKLLLVGQPLGVAADRTLGMEAGATPTVDNAAILNATFANFAQVYPIFFPGKVWEFDHPVVATVAGRSLVGNGVPKLDAGDGANKGIGSRLAWSGGVTEFDGSIKFATTSGTSATITMAGSAPYAVRSDDFLQTLEIKEGGTNFIPGVYHVVAATPGNPGTLTLDRDCTEGAGNGLIASLKYTLWRDDSFGNVYDGLSFRGTPAFTGTATPATRAAVGWQQRTSNAPHTFNTGKVVMRNCSFANFDVGLLLGKGMARFGAMQQDYDGKADNHADHFHAENITYQSCDYGVAIRSGQSLHHLFTNLFFQNCPTAFYVERGGKINARGIWFTNGFTNGPTLLRMGGAGGSVASTPATPTIIDTVSYDAPSPDLKLLVCDGPGDPAGEIELRNIVINPTNATNGRYNVPIVDVKDGWHVTLYNVGPLFPGSIKLDSSGGNFQPSVTLIGCTLAGSEEDLDEVITNPEIVIDEANSTVGTHVRFIGCTYVGYSREFCKEGLYVVDEDPGQGWQWSHP